MIAAFVLAALLAAPSGAAPDATPVAAQRSDATKLVVKHVRALQQEDYRAVAATLADQVTFVTAPWENPEGRLADKGTVVLTFSSLPIAIGTMKSFDCKPTGDLTVSCSVVYIAPQGMAIRQTRDFTVTGGAISKIVINRFERAS